jgi:hypothetical protein
MIRTAPTLAVLLLALALGILAACSGDDAQLEPSVTIEALTPTREAGTPRSGIAIGGKGAMPTATATPVATDTPEPAAPTVAPATEEPPAAPTNTPAPPSAPSEGRWIEVDVTNYVVRLMDGQTVVQEIAPVGVGVAIDTGAYISTQTGLFYVHNKAEPLVYDAPFDTYISHWVGFDAEKDNGFHSFLKDANGNVVDASTGRVSNGCIRTGAAEAVFAYAEIGMPVWVHW